MKNLFPAFVAILAMWVLTQAQDVSRDQRIKAIFDLRDQINTLEQSILLPDAADIENAQGAGFTALRLMPREKYDGVLKTHGGGAYFSFVRLTHEYGQGSDIALEGGRLQVGFAGADYGFISDLGSIPLAEVTLENPEVTFLANYKPPTKMAEIRAEQSKAYNYETPTATYTSRAQAMVGHSYIVRSISFDRSDILVAFKLVRKDSDGSVILFWKTLKNYEKPPILREVPSDDVVKKGN